MPLISNLISQRVISQLDNIGINSKIDGKDSHTSELVKLIVREIVNALLQEAVITVQVNTVGGPNAQSGVGIGGIE